MTSRHRSSRFGSLLSFFKVEASPSDDRSMGVLCVKAAVLSAAYHPGWCIWAENIGCPLEYSLYACVGLSV